MDETRQMREARFNPLYAAHYSAVLAYAWRRRPDLADDVVAETFAIAWRDLERVPDEPLPWLIGVARNVRLNLLRRERRQAERDARGAAAAAMLPRAFTPCFTTLIEERSALCGALGRLPERDREVLMLTAWERLDRDEIAAALGCSRATVAVRLFRARRRLTAALAESELDPARSTVDPRRLADEC
jgi:RNA polymerase sigma-70 factor, ECF subfamily